MDEELSKVERPPDNDAVLDESGEEKKTTPQLGRLADGVLLTDKVCDGTVRPPVPLMTPVKPTVTLLE